MDTQSNTDTGHPKVLRKIGRPINGINDKGRNVRVKSRNLSRPHGLLANYGIVGKYVLESLYDQEFILNIYLGTKVRIVGFG